MKYVYLDYNATAPLLKEVKATMLSVLDMPYNSSSVHNIGRRAKSMIEVARSNILTAIGAPYDQYQLIFTSSGTEANNLVIHNFADSHLFVSAIEHASILKSALDKPNVTIIKVCNNGLLNLEELELELVKSKASTKLVSVMSANNETGVIQNIQEITKIAHKYNALVHTDAVQAFGKIDINVRVLNVDLITISTHKCGGPLGVAALIYRKSIALQPQIIGGGQERGIRSGTENISAIVGFGKIAELIGHILSQYVQVYKLRNLLEESIMLLVPEVKIFSRNVLRLPNTTCLTMPFIHHETQLINFDLAGFAVSAGAACSSGKIETSTVLRAMGVDQNTANTAIRLSLGANNTLNEINKFITTWQLMYNRLAVNFSSQDRALHKDFGQIQSNNYVY